MNLLVTAGPTREALDPVRFFSNYSTGKMGFAVARAAAHAGHHTTLIAGPVSLPTPTGVRRVDVVSAQDMYAAVLHEFPRCDALVMAAAVADWRPRHPAPHKIKKHPGTWTIVMERTHDILTQLRPIKTAQLIVGFAAETQDLVQEATRKLQEKDLDLIVANDLTAPGSGFAVDTNRVVVIGRHAPPESWPLLPKDEVARRLVERIEALSAQA